MSETKDPGLFILDLLALEWGRPADMRVAAKHVPLIALKDTQHILLVIALLVKRPGREPVERPPHQYLQLHPLLLIAEPHLSYQRYVLDSGQQLGLGVVEDLLVAFLFVQEGGTVLEACFLIFFTLQIGLGKENISV